MSTDALLTLLGLLAAVVALLSPERRLDLKMRIRLLDWAVIGTTLLFVHVIKFLPIAITLGIPIVGPWKWGFDEDLASYAITLTGATIVLVHLRMATLHPRRIGHFQNLCESLFFSGRYAELLFLLERNLSALARLVEGRHVVTLLREWAKPLSPLDELLQRRHANGDQPHKTRTAIWLVGQTKSLVWVGARWLPNHDDRQRQARRLLDRIFLSKPFVEYLTTARPYLWLRLLEIDSSFSRQEYLKAFIVALLENKHSVLYDEVRQNQHIKGNDRYFIDPLNPVLHFFFGESFWADTLGMYKPVGDAVADALTERQHDVADPYRLPVGDFVDEGKWRSPVFIGLRLFDFLITEGLHRGVHWHLWLMYLESWTEHIVQNMGALSSTVDHGREFPSPYHYMLYEIVSTLRGWVKTAADLDPSLESVKIDRVDLEHGSIAKSATLTMAACLRIVVTSTYIEPEFKGYLLEVVLSGYGDISDAKVAALPQLYAHAVLRGGSRRTEAGYLSGLKLALDHCDHVKHAMGPSEEFLESLVKQSGYEG